MFNIFDTEFTLFTLQKITGIILVIFFMAPLQWAFWSFKIQKRLVKREIKHRIIESIDSLELTELRLSRIQMEQELRWEHSKEFEFRGQMYDVVRKTETPDSVIFVCWWDHDETRLNKKLKILTNLSLNEHPDSNNRKNQLDRFLSSFYQLSTSHFKFTDDFFEKKYVLFRSFPLSDFQSSFLIPPELYSY